LAHHNPECQAAGNCKLTGGGNITSGKKPRSLFRRTILAGNPPSGSWTDVAHAVKLKFESTAIQSVSCGADTIDFTAQENYRVSREQGPVQFGAVHGAHRGPWESRQACGRLLSAGLYRGRDDAAIGEWRSREPDRHRAGVDYTWHLAVEAQ